ncbi:hypothetical protein SAMN05421693_1356 [Ectothiorhodospira magna]|uniref:Uncharacterized protein n=1 Tax=Ectothiorhodospira magna TaxID=867345 RepID=A0A1H9GC61_9GAMM|nr:hypothetical protein [Ectothiorhodospira magna]SEQ47691.1 hypothetical protein SAMN05421693_1356 [Ectothiorhodospira magna]
MKNSYIENPMDWSENFDDFDSEYWECYLGGPEAFEFSPLPEATDEYDEGIDYEFEDAEDSTPEIKASKTSPEKNASKKSLQRSILRLSRSSRKNLEHKKTTRESEGTFEVNNRMEDIVNWLSSQSRSIHPLRTGDGFFVARGFCGRLPDGSIVDLLEWLLDEGFTQGKIVGEYRISYTPPGGPYREKITFFHCVEALPFAPITASKKL